MRKGLYVLGAVALVAALLACGVFLLGWSSGPDRLLSSLPAPEDGSPSIIIETAKGTFPEGAVKLFFDSPTINQGENSPIKSLLPVFSAASEAGLLVTERDTSIVFSAALFVERKDARDLSAGKVPESWSRLLVLPTMEKSAKAGVWTLKADNLSSPVLVEASDRRVLIAQTAADMDLMMDVRAGKRTGIDKKWAVENKWHSHLYFTDGGALSGILGSAGSSGDGDASPISLELAWKAGSTGKIHPNKKTDDDKSIGEMRWAVSGIEDKLDSSFIRGLKPVAWNKTDMYVPDPPLAVMGLNVPSLSRKMDSWPYALRVLGDQLSKLKLKDRDVQDILSGQMIASLGGRTQILWFTIPGIAFDLPKRGSLGYKLVDAIWSGLFMDANPAPMEGFSHGGTTDLPFTMVAAANDDKALVGLVDPKVPSNKEVPALLDKVGRVVGWLYLDMPRLGDSLSEMTQVNSLLSDGEEQSRPVDTEATDNIKRLMQQMGKVFIVWEKSNTGSAIWYH